MKMKAVRVVLLLGGVALFGALVHNIGMPTILGAFSRLSWRLLLVVVFPFTIIAVLDTLGWRFAFREDRVPFGALFAVRVAGEAFNVATPTAQVGGEAVKAWMLRRWVPLDDGILSVVVAKTTITIAQGLLLLVGIVAARAVMQPGSAVFHGMQWLLLAEVIGVGGFVAVQVSGALGGGGKLLGRLSVLGVGAEALRRLDHALRKFYLRTPERLVPSIVFHFLGWVGGAGEIYVILQFLGIPVSFSTAIVVEAFATGVKFATFIVPGSIGVLEGGNAAMFSALGYGAGLGVTVSLVRRVRELAWVLLGLVTFAALRPGLVGTPTPAVEG